MVVEIVGWNRIWKNIEEKAAKINEMKICSWINDEGWSIDWCLYIFVLNLTHIMYSLSPSPIPFHADDERDDDE